MLCVALSAWAFFYCIFTFSGNGKESRHEYTEYVCSANPKLYLLAHYLYDEYDMDNDHTLERHDYDNFFDAMDTDGK